MCFTLNVSDMAGLRLRAGTPIQRRHVQRSALSRDADDADSCRRAGRASPDTRIADEFAPGPGTFDLLNPRNSAARPDLQRRRPGAPVLQCVTELLVIISTADRDAGEKCRDRPDLGVGKARHPLVPPLAEAIP